MAESEAERFVRTQTFEPVASPCLIEAGASTVMDMKIALIATNLMTGDAIVIDIDAVDSAAAIEAGRDQVPDGWQLLNVCSEDAG